jgi:hypothetical protein
MRHRHAGRAHPGGLIREMGGLRPRTGVARTDLDCGMEGLNSELMGHRVGAVAAL